MATTLRYGEELVAGFPDNAQGLITAEAMRDTIVSQRSGGGLVFDHNAFDVPVVLGTPVNINPLLPSPTVGQGLWGTDANNRQFPNYAAAIPGLTIPVGYQKLVQVFFSIAAAKIGQGEEQYRFQLDNNGTPLGQGVVHTLYPEPSVISMLFNEVARLDAGSLLGLTVTGVTSGDDIAISAFEQFVIDFQMWSAPA